ncbi:MAG: hypothetical protein R3C15_13865 [Thermoleophilia bacterium]
MLDELALEARVLRERQRRAADGRELAGRGRAIRDPEGEQDLHLHRLRALQAVRERVGAGRAGRPAVADVDLEDHVPDHVLLDDRGRCEEADAAGEADRGGDGARAGGEEAQRAAGADHAREYGRRTSGRHPPEGGPGASVSSRA